VSAENLYKAAGVDYGPLDELKRQAQAAALSTAWNLNPHGFLEITGSRGESAYVIDVGPFLLATVQEGLGTKNLVVEALKNVDENGALYYKAAAWDTVAMIVNDLITVGAVPVVINAHWAIGSSKWLESDGGIHLIEGWKAACNESGATWGGGETPILKGIIEPGTIELSGSGFGIIHPKERLTLGDKLQAGDHIILIESSGIHANGLTLARKIAEENLSDGYQTKLPDGRTFGQALLTPTHIYAKLQQALFAKDVDIHYMANITGHGWRKLMRADKDFIYRMHTTPNSQDEFKLMQKAGRISDEDMYSTFNMGAGFAFFVPKDNVERVQKIALELSLQAYDAGVVEKGQRQVIIEPLKIVYPGETLQIR